MAATWMGVGWSKLSMITAGGLPARAGIIPQNSELIISQIYYF